MLTRDSLNASNPELVKAILAEGHAAGLIAGAAAELARIQAVKAQGLPGHEKLIEGLMFDGKTTGEQAGSQVIAAEHAKLEATNGNLKKEAPKPLPAADTPTGDQPKDAPKAEAKTFDKAALEADYAKDDKLKAEFATVGDYLAFKKAEIEGKVRILAK